MGDLFGKLRKLFAQLRVGDLQPFFGRLHGIFLRALATAQEGTNQGADHKREKDRGKICPAPPLRPPGFLCSFIIGIALGRFWIGSVMGSRV